MMPRAMKRTSRGVLRKPFAERASGGGDLPRKIMLERGFMQDADAARRIGRDLFYLRRLRAQHGKKIKSERLGFYWYTEMASLAKALGPTICDALNLTAKNRWGIDEPLPARLAAAG